MVDTTNQEAPKMSPAEEEELELSHTDKLVGVFSEPGNTFTKMSKFGAKTSDWIIPILVVIVVAILSNIVMMSNPVIKLSIMEKQMAQIEKQFDEAVASGQLTEAQKEEQMEVVRERMDQGMAANMIFTILGIVIFSFISFFVVSGVFYLFAKFLLKGSGVYRDAMSAYGLPMYVVVIQVIVMVIVALVMNKFFASLSVAEFLDADKTTIAGFLLNKLDIFSIWFYSIVSIGFAKMFKSEETGKYFAMIFGIWIGFGLIMFLLAKALPFLQWFGF
ncbi:MAG TPA: YIP1 family protein [Melioribacteraceae bacterium]|mgnify:CR=1 FL=1|nr:YIP1 family protein [Melioribacteraceae bacterium]